MERSILIFPEFDNIKLVQEIRQKYDSLYMHIRPHISLVFPFKSTLQNSLIFDVLCKTSQNMSSFSIDISRVSGDYKNGYVWLEIGKNERDIRELHRRLYDNELFSSYELKSKKYIPHITVAQGLQRERAFSLAKELNKRGNSITAKVKSISVEEILANGDSKEIFSKKLITSR
ncbi:hypothetical protein FC89_GL000444 [Liquorilactobacillus ghanensis DSM 18630]|uniref:2'-5' RNA ligase n=1 Tax=Liquorilactobacillus ghanensis DSM 18630 TaxID=1423750 RepID=A0A0R1VMT5_9LACO|nr:2'-5' RNA ligase family protein [Liquorilactobacillus ghanensis]KRM07128.1 hypothetical protein FC89_GL000444 [Liquorilactobacillus ghanensis DSM 18630]